MLYSPRQHKPKEVFQSLEKKIKSKKEELKEKVAPSFSNQMGNLVSGEINKMKRFYPQINRIVDEGKRATNTMIIKTQQEVKKDPWGFLAKTAIISFGVGFILGFYSRNLKSGERP